MRRIPILILAVSALLSSAVSAAVPNYALVKEKSFLKFYAIQNGAPVEGRFDNFTADIAFDPKDLAHSSIAVDVDTGSVAAANSDVQTNLKLPEWLSTQHFPHAQFVSKKIEQMPQSENYFAEGALTLKGKTVPATLNFQFEHLDDKTAVAKGFVTLLRKDFDVGQGEWAKDDIIKNEVRVEFRVAAEKK